MASRTAVVVSTARTGLAKSFRGGFNATHGSALVAHVINGAIDHAPGVEKHDIEDVFIGCGMPEGATGHNVARQGVIRAGLPVEVPAATINRFCSSGLQAISSAAARIIVDGVDVAIGGGVESISLVSPSLNMKYLEDPFLLKTKPEVYMPMIETADVVAKRYGVSREVQDEYSLQSQQRTAAAQAAGVFEGEIVPMETKMAEIKKNEDGTKETIFHDVVVDRDDCNRPSTTLEGLAKLEPVRGPEHFVTPGNASQLSDGASACLLMEGSEAERRGLHPLGIYKGIEVVGNEPDEMGIAPIHAIPKLLNRHGLTMDDIDLWELNEAFAVQTVYIRDHLGIDPEKLNVNGGAISIGHPFGMSASRLVGHALLEGKRRNAKNVVVTMCIGGGMGMAGLFEIA